MTHSPASRAVMVGLLCLFLAATLSACGKKGTIRPPDGKEKEYTYPRQYPR